MKKFSLFALLLVGCGIEPLKQNEIALDTYRVDDNRIRFTRVEYEGHTYILVESRYDDLGGLEHDPDCPCKQVVAEIEE